MKAFFTFWLLVLHLGAAEPFWDDLQKIETDYFTNVGRKSAQEVNATNGKEAKNAELVDARFEAFGKLITRLKADPYGVTKTASPLYDSSTIEERLFKLKSKITINERNGYQVAVDRDRIARDAVTLGRDISLFFTTVAREWTGYNEQQLSERIAQEQEKLAAIPMAEYEAYIGTKRSEALEQNLQTLRMHYYFYQEYLNFLRLNPQTLQHRILERTLKFDVVIQAINDFTFARELNLWLRYVKTDLGHLLLSLLVLLFFWVGSFLVYRRISAYLRRLVLKEEHDQDDLLLSNIENIRRPLLLLIIAFGLEQAMRVLIYPEVFADDNAVFYFIYIATISYIIASLIGNVLFEYIFKYSSSTNEKLRNELLNLIVSVIKVVIFLVALMLFLVKLGVSITGLAPSLGIGGLAVALAAQSTLSNFFGLLKIIYDNSFSQGDWIETEQVEGTVIEIGFISTLVRTFDNALITVPNATLANAVLKNWSRRTVGRRIRMIVGVTYGSDREKLANAVDEIRAMMHAHPGIVDADKFDAKSLRLRRERKLVSAEDKYGVKSALFVHLDEFSDFSINILIYAFTHTVVWGEWLQIREEIMYRIWEILTAHDLAFAFPSQSIYFDRDNLQESLAERMLRNGDAT